MKKLYIVLVFCLLSFNTAYAETLILPSTDTISQYLKYRSGCRTSLQDCLNASSLESFVQSDIRSILSSLPRPETDFERIEKAREKLNKDSEDNYKQLQNELSRLGSTVTSNIQNGFYCVYPTQTCTEDTINKIRGIAIGSGLTPDVNQIASCRAQIDDYNAKLEAYNKCQQDYANQKIESAANSEYESLVLQLKTEILKADKWCKDKEGHYSSYNKDTKECQCIAGSTFVNGWCDSDAQVQMDNFLGCVKTYGSLSKYDSTKKSCICTENSKFNSQTNLCAPVEEQTVVEPVTQTLPIQEKIVESDTTNESYGGFWYPAKTEKVKTKNESRKPVEAKAVSVISPPAVEVSPAPVVQKTTFWQKLKHGFLKIKFW